MPKIEEEMALLIRGNTPWETAAEIAKLEKLSWQYKLVPRPNQKIRDTYYDTPWGSFQSGKSSFRIREINNEKKLITIKGGKFSNVGGVSKRIEQEVEWPFDIEPEQVIDLFDLKPFQIRENFRILRDIEKKNEKKVVAELAIDQLTYHFPDAGKARLFEVEVEAKSSVADVKGIGDELKKKFDTLETWDHSKLSMGKAIETALKVTRNGIILSDASFDAIATLLD
jgi:inorganic triphosphatase YgiF